MIVIERAKICKMARKKYQTTSSLECQILNSIGTKRPCREAAYFQQNPNSRLKFMMIARLLEIATPRQALIPNQEEVLTRNAT